MENEKFSVPPSGLKPHAAAIPSRSVDLPLPFSPTRKVTGWLNSSRLIVFTAGRCNGYSPKAGTLSRSSSVCLKYSRSFFNAHLPPYAILLSLYHYQSFLPSTNGKPGSAYWPSRLSIRPAVSIEIFGYSFNQLQQIWKGFQPLDSGDFLMKGCF
ncbi:hypothetical protein D3C73_1180350 [compost metagenome]